MPEPRSLMYVMDLVLTYINHPATHFLECPLALLPDLTVKPK